MHARWYYDNWAQYYMKAIEEAIVSSSHEVQTWKQNTNKADHGNSPCKISKYRVTLFVVLAKILPTILWRHNTIINVCTILTIINVPFSAWVAPNGKNVKPWQKANNAKVIAFMYVCVSGTPLLQIMNISVQVLQQFNFKRIPEGSLNVVGIGRIIPNAVLFCVCLNYVLGWPLQGLPTWALSVVHRCSIDYVLSLFLTKVFCCRL